MEFQILAILLVAFIFYTLIEAINRSTEYSTEHYDARISNMTIEKCGSICTKTIGCAGFSFDTKKNKCYLSKIPILGQPGESIYKDEYKSDHYRCNKLYVIKNTDDVNSNTLVKNAIYSCADHERGLYDLEMIKDDKIIKPIDKDKIDNLTVEKYSLVGIDWAKEKIDIDINKSETKLNNKSNFFAKREDEYLGQYTQPHMCVANIPELECLKQCSNDQNCVGVEWNPLLMKKVAGSRDKYKIYKNVCCPKAIIKEIIPRRDAFSDGRFYEKLEPNDNLDRSKIYVTF